MDLFSIIHPYLRNATDWIPFLVGLLSIRVMISSFLSPVKNKRVVLLSSLAIASCALLFSKEILAFWNMLMISGFLVISATFSKIRPEIQNKILTVIFTLLIGVGVMGIYSGYVLVFTTGPSMWPTSSKSLSSDILNINAYQNSNIDYADDIHFNVSHHTKWPDGNYRKRVWGLPGDKIQISHHTVKINGLLVADCSDRTNHFAQNAWYCTATFPNGKEIEITWGVVNLLNESQATFTVKENELFLVGDNTIESTDSRYWGSISSNWVEGRFDNSKPIDPQKRVWKPYL